MFLFVVKRLAAGLVVILVISTIAFFLMRAAPGGPFDDERALPASVREAIEARYHLDEPLWMQYRRYMGALVRGDLSPSFRYPGTTVNEIVMRTLPISLTIGLLSMVLATATGLSLGVAAGRSRGRWLDRLLMGGSVLGISVPKIVLAPLLIWVFALKLGWFGVTGDWGKQMILPVIALGASSVAWIARLVRSEVIEVMGKDFVRTARAKGLSEGAIVLKHVLKPALVPVVSYLGPTCAAVFTGSVVVEKIFNIPGMGPQFVDGAFNRDYTLALGLLVVYSVFLVLFNILADVGLVLVDPRVKLTGRLV